LSIYVCSSLDDEHPNDFSANFEDGYESGRQRSAATRRANQQGAAGPATRAEEARTTAGPAAQRKVRTEKLIPRELRQLGGGSPSSRTEDHVLAYNLTRVMNIIGVQSLLVVRHGRFSTTVGNARLIDALRNCGPRIKRWLPDLPKSRDSESARLSCRDWVLRWSSDARFQRIPNTGADSKLMTIYVAAIKGASRPSRQKTTWPPKFEYTTACFAMISWCSQPTACRCGMA
jgi:hypothetical protein